MDALIRISDEVATALREYRPVVALETSVVAQGLPPPANLESARRCAKAVRDGGAIPAAIGVLAGRVVIGMSEEELARLGDPARKPAKAGARDLAALCAQQRDAGTTVSATCAIAERVGIRVFATGGVGGVHRRLDALEPADISADLPEIARRRVCVVCAGPKFILDVPATYEFLETLGVPVWSYRSGELPAFYCGSGLRAEQSFSEPAGVARALRVHWDALESPAGVLLAVPPPIALPREEIEAALAPALREAAARKLPGKEVTPFLLSALSKATGGRTQEANLALLELNAAVAAEISVASRI
jgi:pseudouridine-5'-phosphate glycosidase